MGSVFPCAERPQPAIRTGMIAGFILIAIIVLFRLLPVFIGTTTEQPQWLFNFSPIAALCLCGAAMLPVRLAIAVPFTALLGTDVILNLHYDEPVFSVYLVVKTLAFAAITFFGWQLRHSARAATLIPAALSSSVFFYFATNTASWLYNPGYAKTLAGWTQALTTGLPQYAPTWMFYRNTLLSDLIFTVLFLACFRITHRQAAAAQVASPAAEARW